MLKKSPFVNVRGRERYSVISPEAAILLSLERAGCRAEDGSTNQSIASSIAEGLMMYMRANKFIIEANPDENAPYDNSSEDFLLFKIKEE